MSQKSLGKRSGDFLIHMESRQKCLTFGKIKAPDNGGPFNLDNVVGYPLLEGNVLALAGDEANVVAFIIDGDPIVDLADEASTSGALYAILDRFDGVVLNENVLPAKDASEAAGSLNSASIKGADGVADVKWVSEPDEQTEQTS